MPKKNDVLSEERSELVDFLRIAGIRKTLILLPTALAVLAAGLWSLLSPRVWEVDCLIRTGSLFKQVAGGGLQEIAIIKPEETANQINQGAFNAPIASELGLGPKSFATLAAESIKDTNLVRVSLRTQDVETGRRILLAVFAHQKALTEEYVKVDWLDIDNRIKSQEIEREEVEKKLAVLRDKIEIIRLRMDGISREMKETQTRVDNLENDQRAALKKDGRAEGESLSLLVYSNEIQQNLRYLNSLREALSDKRMDETNLRQDSEMTAQRKQIIENSIALLREMKSRTDLSRLVKDPSPSLRPVSPRPILAVLIAAVLGLAVFTTLAFVLNHLDEHGRASG